MHRTETIFDGDEVIEVTTYDVSWEAVRSSRNQALKDSDWRAGKDVVLSNPWKEYRQALRDLGGFPSSNDAADNWPVKPDE